MNDEAHEPSTALRPSDAFVRSLARGMAVIEAFTDVESLSLAEVAERTQISRPAARRLLLTLCALGYADVDRGVYRLRPRVLALGQAYLSSVRLAPLAEPHLKQLAEQIEESCSLATLDGSDIVYLARVPAGRIMSVVLGVGSRLPASISASGRVLLAELADDELELELERSTPRTGERFRAPDPARLRAAVLQAREQGFAVVDQELEQGLRSVAAPIRDRSGLAVASVGASCHVSRANMSQILSDFVPAVQQTAAVIAGELGHREP